MVLDKEKILEVVVRNAFLHEGRADIKAVTNKIMGEFPEARKNGKDTISTIKQSIDKVNALSREEFSALVSEKYSFLLVKEKKVQEHRLPDLRDVSGTVVMRLAPSPSGPLHIGHSRMAILNDEYVKRYGGKLVLRIEDTNPKNIDPDAYDMIPADLEWLNVNVTDIVIQSERMADYYREAYSLIDNGNMYVCSCEPEEFRKLKLNSTACPHRNISPQENRELFGRILAETKFARGKSLVLKTELNHPNPSIRDWIAFRYVEESHPRQGRKYWFYPLMNFSVAIDDHLLGLTHIMRGKDHLNNTEKQKYIFDYNGWKRPVYYHFGLVNIPDTVLHATEMKSGIKSGKFTGWDDVRLGTIAALRKRGYLPETFRRYWIESGMKEIDAEFSWDIFNSMNRELIDRTARRFFFVPKPVKLELDFKEKVTANIPFHPGNSESGHRTYSFSGRSQIMIPESDMLRIAEGDEFRLKDLCNVLKTGSGYEITQNDHTKKGIKILQWVPETSLNFEVEMQDSSVVKGLIEPLSSNYDGVSQFERFGYVRMYHGKSRGYFLHK